MKWFGVFMLLVFLVGCGTAAPITTPTANVAPTQTRAAELAQIATLAAPTATPLPSPTPVPPTATLVLPTVTPTPVPPTATPTPLPPTPSPTPAYSGQRWHGIPTPGGPKIYQEEVNQIALLVNGTQESVMDLYLTTIKADGFVQIASNTEKADAQAFAFLRQGKRFTVVFGDDIGDGRIMVLINDAP